MTTSGAAVLPSLRAQLPPPVWELVLALVLLGAAPLCELPAHESSRLVPSLLFRATAMPSLFHLGSRGDS